MVLKQAPPVLPELLNSLTPQLPNSLTPEIRNFCEGFRVRSEAERTETEQKLRISGVKELGS